jgi:broad specificity phosphatase PhoE
MALVHLVRHTEVGRHWAGRCYGQSDVPLSRDGREAARTLANRIAELGAERLHVSPLRRARYLGGLVFRKAPAIQLIIEPRLAECHFGAWEGRTWDAIYAESGDAMMGLLNAPQTFRPGGHGETTFAMRDRAMAWLADVLQDEPDPIVAICHGGPIAAIRGTLTDAPVGDWPALVPKYGEIVTLEISSSRVRNRPHKVRNPGAV